MSGRPWQSWREWVVVFCLVAMMGLLVFVFLVSNGAFAR